MDARPWTPSHVTCCLLYGTSLKRASASAETHEQPVLSQTTALQNGCLSSRPASVSFRAAYRHRGTSGSKPMTYLGSALGLFLRPLLFCPCIYIYICICMPLSRGG